MAKSKKDKEQEEHDQEKEQKQSSTPIENSPLYQAWGLTKMRYDFTVGEKNIFLKVIEMCQKYLKKEYLGKDNALVMVKEGFGEEVPMIEFSIKDMLQGNTKNYDWIRKSLETLGNKYFGIPESEGWDFKKTVLFDTIEGSLAKGKLRVTLTQGFWKAFYDLKVFKIIDTNVEYKLSSVYSKRMYELLVGNRNMVTFDIQHLKLMFCAEDKYKNTNMFITRVIKPAQKEMMEADFCPFYFEYIPVMAGRKIEKMNFIVVDKAQVAENEERMNALIKDAEGVTLSKDVLNEVEKCFPRLVIREDVELKLKRLQKQIGADELCKKIGKIKKQADKLSNEGSLKGTVSAYFIGSLDRISEEFKEKENKNKIYKKKIDEAEVVEESSEVYFTIEQLQKKAKLAGLAVEQFIQQFEIEKIDDQTYRMKI